MVSAGWYPDRQNTGLLRWWDGTMWTAYTQPRPASPAPAVQGPGGHQAPVGVPAPSRGSLRGVARHQETSGGKRELRAELARLQQVVAGMGLEEREQLQAEISLLRDEVAHLKGEHAGLLATVTPLRAEVAALAAERIEAGALRAEVQQLRRQRDEMATELRSYLRIQAEAPKMRAEYAQLSRDLIETRETIMLQEVGIYEYNHLLKDAASYKAKLVGLQAQIKDCVKADNAVRKATSWTVNGSVRDGTRMVKEFSKLMLRAYNNEADSAVHSMKPYTLESSVARLEKAKEVITKLGSIMDIQIADRYHELRVEELRLTADYLAKVAEEKERDREVRARLREEEVAKREYERERERLRKEYAHYESAVASLQVRGDHEAAAREEGKLAEIQDAIDGLTRRDANLKAGHVYVISNVGAFGENMVKVGMTRRLDPMDRVRELGDASVPFRYDVHAMVFSDDAVGLEHHLHRELADHRVNLVNVRREFFRVSPSEVRAILNRLDASIVTWVDEPEALEWRQSETVRRQAGLADAQAVPSSPTPA